ncbi:MAG: cyclic pyranopterin phosphate synthase MoaA [Elusimicrobia bacterium RIFCSPLOWO2_01_FULL_59_12]|nr:MAG: cyclic pyranopterin phosphate synthase MoaA [Elusimicrobia bacterium RIFCSPLOWO2_01_FULL_59_12]
MLVDSYGRVVSYLRVSVTDRCNLRCVYCLPASHRPPFLSNDNLTDLELARLAALFAELGVSKIRVTGGEPLLRPGVPDLVRRLAGIGGIDDLSLSTNGLLLGGMAQDLAQAGLKRVNISLDSLNPDKFRQVTRYGDLEAVLAGIDAALAAGLSPVKLNVVVARGMNEEEIGDFVRLTEDRPLHVRLIELMPMGETGFFSQERWMPLPEMMEKASPLQELPRDAWPLGHGPARYYRRPGALGTVGFVSALSRGFCSSCNRLRLTAGGLLVPCLDAAEGTDLRAPLRRGADAGEIRRLVLETVQRKPERHTLLERASSLSPNPRLMCQIGG